MLNILHVDIDAFYASVEELSNPKLKKYPVAVGHNSQKGIITTANYKARQYGVHSAMPVFMAKKLCPDLIIVPLHREKYLQKSKEVFNILHQYSSKVQQVSIDEAYLEIEGENSEETAREIMKKIPEITGLTVSVGLSYNKFLAKIASDWNKPRGLKIITEEEVPEILLPLDIRKVHGIGEKTQQKLRKIGINTVEDMMQLSEQYMQEHFGKAGTELYYRIRGIDNRKVETHQERKSISVERTFENTDSIEELLEKLDRYSEELYKDLKKRNLKCRTITVKIKNSEFVNTTKSRTFDHQIEEQEEIGKIAEELFKEAYKNEKIRLLGVSASNLEEDSYTQLNFLDIK